MIGFRCPKCRQRMSVPDSLAGLSETCPTCGNVTIVPRAVGAAVPPPAPGEGQAVRAAGSGPAEAAPGEEQVLWSGRPSWKAYLAKYFAAGLIFVAGIVLSILATGSGGGTWGLAAVGCLLLSAASVVSTELRRRFTGYRITGRVICHKRGILSLSTDELPVAHLREVTLRQGLLDRIFDIGTLGFSTAASSGTEIIWPGVERPGLVRDLVRKLMQ